MAVGFHVGIALGNSDGNSDVAIVGSKLGTVDGPRVGGLDRD